MSAKNNYDNLDFLLNIYYDLVYHKNPEKDYRLEPISRKNIEMIDLKKPSDFDSSYIFSGDFKYLGFRNGRLHFKRKSKTGGYPCELSIGFYETNNVTNTSKGILYDVAMMYMISELVVNEKFKHSVLPVMLFDMKYDDLKQKIPDIDKYVTKYNMKCDEHCIAYCLITEHFFEMMSLREYLEKNAANMSEIDWKILFFQVFFALYKISDRMTQFRHNHLDLDSIVVYIKSSADETSIIYKVGDTKFSVPNVGFDIKLADYDMASTLDYLTNTSVGKKKYNDYYDVNYFTEYLYLWLTENSIKVPKTILGFIKDIVPDEMTDKNVKTTANFNGMDESIDHKDMDNIKTIPAIILKKNKFFNEFIQSSVGAGEKNRHYIEIEI